MSNCAIFLQAIFVAVARGQYGNYYEPVPSGILEVIDNQEPYEFSYDCPNGVKVQERRDDKKVTGEYTVPQPDGCIRIVSYAVDEEGYKPVITYTENCNTEHYQAPAIPVDHIETAKVNLEKVAETAAKIATAYKTIAHTHKKISEYHEKTKAEMTAQSL